MEATLRRSSEIDSVFRSKEAFLEKVKVAGKKVEMLGAEVRLGVLDGLWDKAFGEKVNGFSLFDEFVVSWFFLFIWVVMDCVERSRL